MDYGKRISTYRKLKGLTQAELGKELNVSSQAVSKWEQNQSQPDLDTVNKLCSIFDIPIAEFFDEEIKTKNAIEDKTPQKKPEVENIRHCRECGTQLNAFNTSVHDYSICRSCERARSNKQLGVCMECGTVITEFNLGQSSPKVLCSNCTANKQEKKRADRAISARRRTKAYIVASIICLIPLIIFIASSTTATSVGEAFEIIGFGLVLVYLLFALIFQLYFDGPVSDVFFWGITRTVRMPGVIFTLDIGGIIFLITVKLALAILSFLLGVFFALLGLLIASLIAGFTFPFMVIKVNRSVREGNDLSPI